MHARDIEKPLDTFGGSPLTPSDNIREHKYLGTYVAYARVRVM